MKREVREQRLHDLVERYLARLSVCQERAPTDGSVDLIAYSPDSPIAVAVAARLPELGRTGVVVRAIFAHALPEPSMATWLAGAGWVRLVRDKRLLEAHEQLILGSVCCWSGDAMRRSAGKTDLFESLNENSTTSAEAGRRAFDKLATLASVIRPRRVTASLNAVPRDQEPVAKAPFDGVVPAPDAADGPRLLTTRH